MKKIAVYLKDYVFALHKAVFFFTASFTALLVFLNYNFGLNSLLYRLPQFWGSFAGWYGLFLTALFFGYLLNRVFLGATYLADPKFLALLLLAPAVFAWKMVADVRLQLASDYFENEYWNAVTYWPIKVLVVTAALLILHRVFDKEQNFYGVTRKNFNAGPYLLMLLLMVPLIASAALQNDFLSLYPRFQNVAYLLQPNRTLHKLLYELSYGSDFFSIELYFRGFLVLAFARWAGKDAILPMAIFYCTIHFGKPLGECISSFFGGIILGVVTYNTRTILGGFAVHVGIAWLMEVAGYLSKM